MKILFLSNYFPYPPDTGTKMRSLNFLRYLARKGRVTLVAPTLISERAHVDSLRRYCEEIVLVDGRVFGPNSKRDEEIGISARLKRLFALEPWSMSDFVSEEFKRKLISLEPEKFDLIFIRYPQLAYYLLMDKRFKKVLPKVVIDVDDVGILMQERRVRNMKSGYGKVRNIVDLLFLKNYYRKLRKVWACFITSRKDKEFLMKEGFSRNVFVIPNTIEVNGVDREQKASLEKPEILFCGTLSFPHNEEAVLYFAEKVFPLIKQAIPEVCFTVVGKKPTERILKLNSVTNISVIGPVASVAPYYKKAAIAVVPLLNGAGTRIKILEAMALARAVVSTSIGAEGLDVKDGENIVVADDPGVFAEKCIELLHDQEKREHIALKGYQFVKEEYDIPVFEKKMDEFFTAFEEVNVCLT